MNHEEQRRHEGKVKIEINGQVEQAEVVALGTKRITGLQQKSRKN
jgi:hypothetical protein